MAGNFRTLVEALLAAPPDHPFITMWRDDDDIETVSFGEFICLARAQAANLGRLGMSSGDTVILILPQGISLMATFAGALLLGAVPAILAYPNFKVEPVKYASGLAGVSQNLKARWVIIDDEFPTDLRAHFATADGAQIVHAGPSSISPAASLPLLAVASDPDDIAFIQHSAGTTGLQKGVALTHRAVLTQLDHLASRLQIGSDDRVYSWLPLYHDMGLIACFILPLAYHLPIIMQAPMDWVLRPATMLKLISDYRCTLAWVPNFALQFLARRVRAEDRAQVRLSSLRSLINCSEPVKAASMDEFEAAYAPFGLPSHALKSSYAMAENVFAVTQSDVSGRPHRLWVDAKRFWHEQLAIPVAHNADGALCFVSSGRCLPGNEVQVVAADGTVVPDGTVGE